METTKSMREPPRAPVRSMQVLEGLAGTREAVSLAALSARFDLPKTSLMHLLRALEAAGYVRRASGGYKLAASSLRLAAAIQGTMSFEDVTGDVLQALRDSTQETALLGAIAADGMSAVYTDRRASSLPVRFAPEIGERRPLYATGVGTLLLAYSPPEFVRDYLTRVRIVPQTSRTVRTKTALKEKLARIRADGAAMSIDEMVVGGSSIAAPVFKASGELRAALVLAVPTARFLVNRHRLEAQVRAAAEELSGMSVAHSG